MRSGPLIATLALAGTLTFAARGSRRQLAERLGGSPQSVGGSRSRVPAVAPFTGDDPWSRLEDAVLNDTRRLDQLEARGSPQVAGLDARLARVEVALDLNRALMLIVLGALLPGAAAVLLGMAGVKRSAAALQTAHGQVNNRLSELMGALRTSPQEGEGTVTCPLGQTVEIRMGALAGRLDALAGAVDRLSQRSRRPESEE